MVNHKLKYFRALNKLLINTLKNSIFKNLTVLIHGPIILLNSNNADLTFKELENINSLINLLALRLNNKVYSKRQIQKLRKISYFENVSVFHKTMKTFTRMPYYKLKSKRILPISK